MPTNLPVLVTELIGRSDDRDRIAALLHTERLVTLTGVGTDSYAGAYDATEGARIFTVTREDRYRVAIDKGVDHVGVKMAAPALDRKSVV